MLPVMPHWHGGLRLTSSALVLWQLMALALGPVLLHYSSETTGVRSDRGGGVSGLRSSAHAGRQLSHAFGVYRGNNRGRRCLRPDFKSQPGYEPVYADGLSRRTGSTGRNE